MRAASPDTLLLVDAVSSAGGVDLRPEEWGIDVLLTSSQKCFALPPGLAFAAVSDRALERAAAVAHRGAVSVYERQQFWVQQMPRLSRQH